MSKPKMYAYEIDSFGNGDTAWEVYLSNDIHFVTVERDEFGNFLDSAVTFGYDVLINTYASWEAMDNV